MYMHETWFELDITRQLLSSQHKRQEMTLFFVCKEVLLFDTDDHHGAKRKMNGDALVDLFPPPAVEVEFLRSCLVFDVILPTGQPVNEPDGQTMGTPYYRQGWLQRRCYTTITTTTTITMRPSVQSLEGSFRRGVWFCQVALARLR